MFFGPNCIIISEKFYAQEELKPWNETRKLQLCAIYRWVHRRRHAEGTAVGGKGDCGGEGDSSRRRRRRGGGREGDGLPAGARALACVGETSSSARTELKSAKFLASASGHLKSLKRTQIA